MNSIEYNENGDEREISFLGNAFIQKNSLLTSKEEEKALFICVRICYFPLVPVFLFHGFAEETFVGGGIF